jgi:hypothetical protein
MKRLTLEQMRDRVNTAVTEANALEPEREVLITWGERDKDAEIRRRRVKAKDRWLGALVTFKCEHAWDVELEVQHMPHSAGFVFLRTDWIGRLLPRRDARKLFNVLEALRPGVRLLIIPEPRYRADGRKRNEKNPGILITRLATELPVVKLTGSTLDRALFSLTASANAVERILHDDATPDDDQWSQEWEEADS